MDGQSVLRFSLGFTARATTVAITLVVLIHLAMDALGALPYPLTQALVVGISVTSVVASSLTFMLIYYVGLALRDLTISRNDFKRLSETDALSGLMNRRAFFQIVEALTEPASLVIFDLDRFKQINDRFGHDVGDRVIAGLSGLLADEFGHDSKALARLGGEEFALLIEAEDFQSLLTRLAAVQQRLRSADFGTGELRVTVSAGIAELTDGRRIFPVYKAADQALYIAKASGRDRIVHERDIAIIGDAVPIDASACA